jgi:hypothetical protein
LLRWHGTGGAAGVCEQGRGKRGLSRNLGGPNCSTARDWFMGDHREVARNIQACPDPTFLELGRRYE